jgi:hypothetical protein
LWGSGVEDGLVDLLSLRRTRWSRFCMDFMRGSDRVRSRTKRMVRSVS